MSSPSEISIRNVVFDWSGTLVDDLPAVWRAANHVLETAGARRLGLEEFRDEFSLPPEPFFRRHAPYLSLAEVTELFLGHIHKELENIGLLPHAGEFLDFCRERGFRMFLLTAVPEAHFGAVAERLGIAGSFEQCYLGITDKREQAKALLEENGLDPGETLYVGDMLHDLESARGAGMLSCAVLTGYNRLDRLREGDPDLIVEHLGELRDLIARERLARRLEEKTHPDPDRTRLPIPSVGGLIRDAQGRALMVRTRKWSDRWGMPGGKIRFGESAAAAFVREMKEETGLDVREVEFHVLIDCVEPVEFYRPEHFILIAYTCECEAGAEVTLNDEAQEYRWVSLEDALEMDLNEPTELLIRDVLDVA